MKKTRLGKTTLALSTAVMATIAISATPASAVSLAIEFVQADQAGFDIWPSTIAGASSTANFTTPANTTSGTTTVIVSTSSGFGMPANRGSFVDGTPAGFTYAGLYGDILHATSPTGVLTLDFTGLNPSEIYQFTLYARDPGNNVNTGRTWSVTGGTGTPSSNTLNWSDPLVDNDTFAMKFDIMTDGTGAFQLTDTGNLAGSAINGFKLSQVPEPSAAVLALLGALGCVIRRRRR